VYDLNTPSSSIDGTSIQKIHKDILELKNTIDEMNLTAFYRVFHPTAADYTFCSAAHGTFSKIDHMLGHKVSLIKLIS
jgi:serine phosphatase RsbU (regulator of sigma subunit)